MWFSSLGSWKASFHTFFLLLTLVLNVAAQELGLALDRTALADADRIVYSSKLTFEQDTGTLFDDNNLYGLARRAYEEMKSKFGADDIPPPIQPAMMAAMAIGKDVYLSSSIQKGSYVYTYTDTRLKPEVVLALERCQTSLQQDREGVPIDGEHRTKAGCAEIAALHQYYLDPDVSDAGRRDRPATRVVAYGLGGGYRKPGQKPGVIAPQNPCGGGETVVDGLVTWGCKQFMAKEGITVPRKPKPVAINLPEPFPPFTKKQISVVCPGLKGN